jgi:hypothetical protein
MAGEIALDGVTYLWALFGGVVTVTAPDGRQKSTQLGCSPPQVIAWLLARELSNQKPKK